MFCENVFGYSYMWIFPVVMMVIYFLMMRGRRNSTMCQFGERSSDIDRIYDSNSAIEILDKRYAIGEINTEEYEEKKSVLKKV